jgi:hypothetical protein
LQNQKVKAHADAFKKTENATEAMKDNVTDQVSDQVSQFMLQVIQSVQKKAEKAELEEPFKQINEKITKRIMNRYAFLNILTYSDEKAISITLETQAKRIRGGFENYFELVYDQLNYMSEKDLLQIAEEYKRFLARLDLKFLVALQEHQLNGQELQAIEIKLPHLDNPDRIKALAKLNFED